MELQDKAAAVSRMQHYIEAHLDEEITLDDLANAAGYSKYHAVREPLVWKFRLIIANKFRVAVMQ